MIVIINYGMGNLGSIANMLKRVGAEAVVSANLDDIEKATKLILPGVGAFDNGMRNLAERGLIPLLKRKVMEEKTPILGICLGVQLFTKRSEEGILPGLGWIDADTVKFRHDQASCALKVPHMGWNSVRFVGSSRLFNEMYENPRFYFVHTYHVVCRDETDILTQTSYGYEFVSAVQKGHIIGVQFHPEKSHKFGMKLIDNFVRYF